MSGETEVGKPESKVLSLSAFKQKKASRDEIARGRQPLYMSHDDGVVSGRNRATEHKGEENFGDRMHKIRASLDRINTLMSELKKLSSKERPN